MLLNRRVIRLLPVVMLLMACGTQTPTATISPSPTIRATTQLQATPAPLNKITEEPCPKQIQVFQYGKEVFDEVGGVWLNPPQKNADIPGRTLIRFQAYPEGANAQAVHHVKFTMKFPGWNVVAEVCTSDITVSKVYSFWLDLAELGVPAGTTVEFSADIYSVSGNFRKQPNGPRLLTNRPDLATPTR